MDFFLSRSGIVHASKDGKRSLCCALTERMKPAFQKDGRMCIPCSCIGRIQSERHESYDALKKSKVYLDVVAELEAIEITRISRGEIALEEDRLMRRCGAARQHGRRMDLVNEGSDRDDAMGVLLLEDPAVALSRVDMTNLMTEIRVAGRGAREQLNPKPGKKPKGQKGAEPPVPVDVQAWRKDLEDLYEEAKSSLPLYQSVAQQRYWIDWRKRQSAWCRTCESFTYNRVREFGYYTKGAGVRVYSYDLTCACCGGVSTRYCESLFARNYLGRGILW